MRTFRTYIFTLDSISDGISFALACEVSYYVGARGIHVTTVTSGCTLIHICENKQTFI